MFSLSISIRWPLSSTSWNRVPGSRPSMSPGDGGCQLFGPDAEEPSFWSIDLMQLLSIFRSLVGIVAAESVYSRFKQDFIESGSVSWFLAVIISMGIAFLFTAAVAVKRRDFSKENRHPGTRAFMGLLVMGGLALLNHLRYQNPIIVGLIFEIPFLWWLVFWTICWVYWIRYPFGNSKAYPSLGPIVTGATIIVVMLISLIRGDSDRVPVTVWLGVTLAGATTALALVALELYLIHRDSARHAESQNNPSEQYGNSVPAASAGPTEPSEQPFGQRSYQSAASNQPTGAYQPADPYQPAAAPYEAQASRPTSSPPYPRTYQFEPAGHGLVRRSYKRLIAILSAMVLAILVTVYSLHHFARPGAENSPHSQRPSPQVPSRAQRYASSSLATSSPSIKARMYFGQLDAIVSALKGQAIFNLAGSLRATNPGLCVGTVLFSDVNSSTGAVYGLGLGSGWTAAESAPSPDTEDGNLHQQLVVPPVGASVGDSWHLSADLIAGKLQVQSDKYSLQLQSKNGTADNRLVRCNP